MNKKGFMLFPVLLLTLTSCGTESFTPVSKEEAPTKIAEYKGKLPEEVKKAGLSKGISASAELIVNSKKSSIETVMSVVDGYLHTSVEINGPTSEMLTVAYVEDGVYYSATSVGAYIENEWHEVKAYVTAPALQCEIKFEGLNTPEGINEYFVTENGGGIENVTAALDEFLAELANSTKGVSLEVGNAGGVKLVTADAYVAFDSAARVEETYTHIAAEGVDASFKTNIDYDASFKAPSLRKYKGVKDLTVEEVGYLAALPAAVLADIGATLLM